MRAGARGGHPAASAMVLPNRRKVGIAPPAPSRSPADGDVDPRMIEVHSSHGKTHFERGDVQAALDEFEEAHRVAVAIDAPDASMAQLLNNLALCSQQLGRWKEATDFCERCLLVRRNFQPDTHTEYIKCSNHLANCYYHCKKYTDAKRIYDDVLLVLTNKLGETHADTMRAMHNAGLMAFHCGKTQEAERVLASCMRLRQSILGDAHPDTQSTKAALVDVTASGACSIM